MYVEALVGAFTCGDVEVVAVAKQCLQDLYDDFVAIVGQEVVLSLPAFHLLAAKFCSACYKQRWTEKIGACQGIDTLLTKLQLGTHWILDHIIEFVKGLLYTIKDFPRDFMATYQD